MNLCDGGVSLAALSHSPEGKREARRYKVHVPSLGDERIFPRHDPLADDDLALGHQAPAAGAERLVQDAAVLDLGQVDDAVGLDLDVGWVDGLQQDVDDLLGEARCAEAVVRSRPVDDAVAVAVLASAPVAVGGAVVEGRGGQRGGGGERGADGSVGFGGRWGRRRGW